MADFDINTITAQGAIAIASATAGDKLVIDGCDATTQVLTKAQAVQIGTRPVSPASTTTSIALAGSTDNHVYAYASFIKGETGQPGGDVHSFFLYGHMESTPNSIIVIAIASATDDIHLPTSSDVTNRTEIQFELTFSATDEVVTVADTSMYTTRGEFLLLKNRTVTTHAEGEATTGEDQTIFGSKTFVDEIRVDYVALPADSQLSGVKVAANIYPEDDQEYGLGVTGYAWNGVRAWEVHTTELKNDLDSGTQPIGVYSTLSPVGQNSPTLGDASHRWATVYSEDVVCEGVVCERVSVSSSGTNYLLLDDTGIFPHDSDMTLGGNNSTWGTIFVNDIALGGSNGRYIYFEDNSEDIYVSGDLVPEDTSNYELGTSDHTWLTVYTEAISLSNTRTICLNSDDDIKINGPLVPDTNASHSIGSSDYRFGSVWASSVIANDISTNGEDEFNAGANNSHGHAWLYCDLTASPYNAQIDILDQTEGEAVKFYFDRGVFYADSTYGHVDFGSSTYPWGEVYAYAFNGLLPRPSSSSSLRDKPPVGTVFLACIEKDGSSGVTVMYPGTEITPSNQNPDAVAIYYGEITTGPTDSGGYRGIFVKGTQIGHPSTAQYILMSQADFNNTTYAFAFVQVKSIS